MSETVTEEITPAERLKAWRATRLERARVWAAGWSLRSLLLLRGNGSYGVDKTTIDWRDERGARKRAVIDRLGEFDQTEIERELVVIEREYTAAPIKNLRQIYPKREV